MAKSKKQNKSQSLLKTLKLLLKSVNVLYLILILAVVQICSLLLKNDNITLFLFIILSATIYTIDKNMIMVLGIPLVITSVLLLLKHFFLPKMNEGFDDMENFDETDFLKWSTDYFNNDNKYLEYTEEIDNKGSLKDAVTKLLNNETTETYLNYMLYIASLDKANNDYNKEQSIYVRGIVKMYVGEKNEELTKNIMDKNEVENETEKEETIEKEEEDIEQELNELTKDTEINENVENFIGKYKLF